jgi:hypothetical protein
MLWRFEGKFDTSDLLAKTSDVPHATAYLPFCLGWSFERSQNILLMRASEF